MMPETEEQEPESEDIVSDFDNSPEGQLRQSDQEERLSDDDFDYHQGFNYPENQIKDSITKFYRHVISLNKPKNVVRVANFTFKESKNAKMFLNIADYNRLEGCNTIANWLEGKAVVEAAVSMGKKGFIVSSIMTQRRIVQRQTEKSSGISSWNKPKQGAGGRA